MPSIAYSNVIVIFNYGNIKDPDGVLHVVEGESDTILYHFVNPTEVLLMTMSIC